MAPSARRRRTPSSKSFWRRRSWRRHAPSKTQPRRNLGFYGRSIRNPAYAQPIHARMQHISVLDASKGQQAYASHGWALLQGLSGDLVVCAGLQSDPPCSARRRSLNDMESRRESGTIGSLEKGFQPKGDCFKHCWP